MKTKVNFQIWLLVSVFLAVAAGPAVARTIIVDPNGSADFEKIQEAIDDGATVDYDTVEVREGTYNEAINFGGKPITVRSTDPNDPVVVAATIIDATGLGSWVVAFGTGEGSDSVLAGFTIKGGSGNPGGAMIINQCSPTITKCVFTGNTSSGSGGGIYNQIANPTITNCTFTLNTAASGSGGGIYNNGSNPTITNCIFTENTAMLGGASTTITAIQM